MTILIEYLGTNWASSSRRTTAIARTPRGTTYHYGCYDPPFRVVSAVDAAASYCAANYPGALVAIEGPDRCDILHWPARGESRVEVA